MLNYLRLFFNNYYDLQRTRFCVIINVMHKDYTHIWFWKSRLGEKNRKGIKCRILVEGSKNSILVELEDSEWVVCSRHSVREIPKSHEVFDSFFE
jgi:hypothetical protein